MSCFTLVIGDVLFTAAHSGTSHQMNMREIRQRIVRHVLVEHRPDAMRGGARHHHEVRIAARLGDDVGAQHAARARLVLDDDRLSQPRAEPFRQGARQDVGGTGRREVDDPADRLGGQRLAPPRCLAPPRTQRSGVDVEKAWKSPSLRAMNADGMVHMQDVPR